jgi:hypothetical protein
MKLLVMFEHPHEYQMLIQSAVVVDLPMMAV